MTHDEWIAENLPKLASVAEGGRNRALYNAACVLGRMVQGGHIGEADAMDRLVSASPLGAAESRRTAASGMRAGRKLDPWTAARNGRREGTGTHRARVPVHSRAALPAPVVEVPPTTHWRLDSDTAATRRESIRMRILALMVEDDWGEWGAAVQAIAEYDELAVGSPDAREVPGGGFVTLEPEDRQWM